MICSILVIGIGINFIHYFLSFYYINEVNDALIKNPQELKLVGIKHYRKGQYDQAINLFKEALSVDPNNYALYLYETLGFKKVSESGTSWTMLKDLD